MEASQTLTATMTNAVDGTGHVEKPRHFAVELLGLILRIMATALAINIVFAAIVLLLAGQAAAADSPADAGIASASVHQLPPGRADPACKRPTARDHELMLLHRMTLGLPTPPSVAEH